MNKVTTITSSAAIKIMPLGDSITWGVKPDDTTSPGYRRPLYLQLNTDGYKTNFVGTQQNGLPHDYDWDNEGHPGWYALRTSDISKSMYNHFNDFLTTNPPDIVLLHIGTNDISAVSTENRTAAAIADKVRESIHIIYNFNPNIKTIIARIIDRADNSTSHQKTIDFNDSLQHRVDSLINLGRDIKIVNMYSALGDYYTNHSNPNFTYLAGNNTNLLHPNTTGYQTMADTWLPVLENYLPVLRLRVFLEGPYTSGGTMTTLLNRTDLTSSPYSEDPKAVTYTVPDSVTDWVLLQFRNVYNGSAIASKSCFVSEHGYVIDPDGFSTNISLGISPGSYYIVVKHRNHLAIMSADKLELDGITSYDFTTGSDKYYGTTSGAKEVETNVWGMLAGDTNGDGGVGVEDYSEYKMTQGQEGYDKIADFNCDGGVGVEDYSLYKLNQGKESAVLPY